MRTVPPTRVSFVVPVRNDAARLEVCLRSVRVNGTPSDGIDVLVIDNGSEDESAEVARRFGAHVLVHDGPRVAELRNIGARHASGDVLGFVDADNEISSEWVHAALETLEDPAVAAAGAHYHPPQDGTWVQKAYGLLRGRPQGRHDTDWLGSGNLVIRREVFERVGGFDATLETCEDVDLCHRVRALGYRIVSDARLRSIHHGDPSTLGAVFRGERWRGRDNLRVSFRRPVSWKSIPSALIPVFDTVMLVLSVLGVMATLAGRSWGPAVGAAGLLGISLGALLKVGRAASREPLLRGSRLPQAFLVALVYDVGRALALVSPAPHRNVTPAVVRRS